MAGPYRKGYKTDLIRQQAKKTDANELAYMVKRANRDENYGREPSGADKLEYSRYRNIKNAQRRGYVNENGIDRKDAKLNKYDMDKEVGYTVGSNMKWREMSRKYRNKK